MLFHPDPLVGDVPEELEAAFVAWCKSNGVLAPKFQYPAFDQFGLRGVLATEDIAKGETLISVPARLCLTPSVCRGDLTVGPVWEDPRIAPIVDTEVDTLMACYLAWIRTVRKEEHPLWPWVRTIPDQDTLGDWSEVELAALQDDVLANTARERRALMEEKAQTCVHALNSAFPTLFPPDEYTVPWWKWAAKQLTARAFGRRVPSVHMVPLADCCNHGPVTMKYRLDPPLEQGREWTAVQEPLHGDGEGSEEPDPYAATERSLALSRGYPQPTGTFVIYLTKDTEYKKGEQVLISYGKRDNAFLLLEYGFCLPSGNEWDTVSIRLRPLAQQSTNAKAATSPTLSAAGSPKLAAAAAAKAPPSSIGEDPTWAPITVPTACKELFSAVSAAGRPYAVGSKAWPAEALATYRVVTANEEDISAWKAGKILLWTRRVSRENESRALASFSAHLRLIAQGYATTMEEDETALREGDVALALKGEHDTLVEEVRNDAGPSGKLPPRLWLAVAYRSLRKRLLLRMSRAAALLCDSIDVCAPGVSGMPHATPALSSKQVATYMKTGVLSEAGWAALWTAAGSR